MPGLVVTAVVLEWATLQVRGATVLHGVQQLAVCHARHVGSTGGALGGSGGVQHGAWALPMQPPHILAVSATAAPDGEEGPWGPDRVHEPSPAPPALENGNGAGPRGSEERRRQLQQLLCVSRAGELLAASSHGASGSSVLPQTSPAAEGTGAAGQGEHQHHPGATPKPLSAWAAAAAAQVPALHLPHLVSACFSPEGAALLLVAPEAWALLVCADCRAAGHTASTDPAFLLVASSLGSGPCASPLLGHAPSLHGLPGQPNPYPHFQHYPSSGSVSPGGSPSFSASPASPTGGWLSGIGPGIKPLHQLKQQRPHSLESVGAGAALPMLVENGGQGGPVYSPGLSMSMGAGSHSAGGVAEEGGPLSPGAGRASPRPGLLRHAATMQPPLHSMQQAAGGAAGGAGGGAGRMSASSWAGGTFLPAPRTQGPAATAGGTAAASAAASASASAAAAAEHPQGQGVDGPLLSCMLWDARGFCMEVGLHKEGAITQVLLPMPHGLHAHAVGTPAGLTCSGSSRPTLCAVAPAAFSASFSTPSNVGRDPHLVFACTLAGGTGQASKQGVGQGGGGQEAEGIRATCAASSVPDISLAWVRLGTPGGNPCAIHAWEAGLACSASSTLAVEVLAESRWSNCWGSRAPSYQARQLPHTCKTVTATCPADSSTSSSTQVPTCKRAPGEEQQVEQDQKGRGDANGHHPAAPAAADAAADGAPTAAALEPSALPAAPVGVPSMPPLSLSPSPYTHDGLLHARKRSRRSSSSSPNAGSGQGQGQGRTVGALQGSAHSWQANQLSPQQGPQQGQGQRARVVQASLVKADGSDEVGGWVGGLYGIGIASIFLLCFSCSAMWALCMPSPALEAFGTPHDSSRCHAVRAVPAAGAGAAGVGGRPYAGHAAGRLRSARAWDGNRAAAGQPEPADAGPQCERHVPGERAGVAPMKARA